MAESRPLYEGVDVARAWAAAGVEVQVITDAQMAAFVGQVGRDRLGTASQRGGRGSMAASAAATECAAGWALNWKQLPQQ